MATNLPEYPDAPRKDTFQAGLEFQDFVMELLARRFGWAIHSNSSRAYQFKKGESVQRFEFKLDEPCTKYGRLSIEVGEKSRKSIAVWTRSGILRGDNTIFYVQGNFKSVWLFFVHHLRLFYRDAKPEVVEKFGTIQTFYLPFKIADELGIRIDGEAEQTKFLV